MLLPVCLFTACQEDMAHQFCAIDCNGWSQNAKARFCIAELKGHKTYDLALEARIGKRYPYRDLWVAVDTRLHGNPYTSDTLCLDIVSPTGEMDGYGRELLEYQMPVRQFRLDSRDTLEVCVRHIMSAKVIPGVHDIGIRLESGLKDGRKREMFFWDRQ